MSSPFVKLFSKNLYSLYNGDFDEKTGEPKPSRVDRLFSYPTLTIFIAIIGTITPASMYSELRTVDTIPKMRVLP